MKQLQLLLATLGLALPASAQTWSRTFEGFSYSNALAADGDQVWAASGDALVHLDADGTVLGEWSVEPYTTDIQLGPNGSKVLCGSWGGWIGKYDASNQLEWGWFVVPAGYWEYAHFYGLDVTADGGVVAIGNRWYTDVAYEDDWGELLLCRFDASGTLLWDLRAGDFDDMTYFGGTDVEELADGSFFFVGRGGYLPIMTCGRVSAAGNLLWLKEVTGGGEGWSPKVALLAAGDLVAIDGGQLVVRMDADGNVVWKQRIVGDQLLVGVAATLDGGVVAVGYSSRPDGSSWDLFYAKLSASGDLEWQGLQGGAPYEFGQDVAIASNGDLLFAGSDASNNRAIVQRFDGLGQSSGCDVVPGYAQFEAVAEPNVPLGEPSGPTPDSLVPYQTPAVPDDHAVLDACLSLAIGVRYCDPAVSNSTGSPAEMWVAGEASIAVNSVTLIADDLPPDQMGYFLVGMGTGVMNPPGSQGNLCLTGSAIHRYAKFAKSAGAAGVIELGIDLTAIPGHGKVKAGETWNFQAWYRDKNPQNTSNFTDAVSVTFVP